MCVFMNSLFWISNYEDVKSLWENRTRETISLDYKREISKDSKEICKDITSFANSEGGVIIYGVGEDKTGLPTYSEGVVSNKNSERIQQIISSSISPVLDIKIDVIDVFDKNNKSVSRKEFVVVKIPKSSYYIHQVTTTKKFYFRANTTTNSFDAFEMSEHDISLRYNERFRNEQKQRDIILEKQKEVKERFSYERMFFTSAVPQISVVTPINITDELLRNILLKNHSSSGGTQIYRYLSWNQSHPTGNGREININYSDRPNLKKHLEVNKDRTILYAYPIVEYSPDGNVITIYDISNLAEFLFAINKFYELIDHTSGITITFSLVNIRGLKFAYHTGWSNREIEIGKDNISIKKEIAFLPFEPEKIIYEIIVEFCENLGMDNALEHLFHYKDDLETLMKNIKNNYSK